MNGYTSTKCVILRQSLLLDFIEQYPFYLAKNNTRICVFPQEENIKIKIKKIIINNK